MGQCKKNVTDGLRSARYWLQQAEDAFGKERGVRGELDLLLAQAELQRVKEGQRRGQWRYKYPLLRQLASFTIAGCIAAVGVGGAYWWLHRTPEAALQKVVEQQQAGQEASVPSTPSLLPVAEAAQAEEASKEPVAAAVNAPSAAATRQERTVAPAHVETASPSAKEEVLSQAELRQLVHTAGKSLRAQ